MQSFFYVLYLVFFSFDCLIYFYQLDSLSHGWLPDLSFQYLFLSRKSCLFNCLFSISTNRPSEISESLRPKLSPGTPDFVISLSGIIIHWGKNLWNFLGCVICFSHPVVAMPCPFSIKVSFAGIFFPFLLPALLLRLLINSVLPPLLQAWQELVYPSSVSPLYQSGKLRHYEC